MVLPNKLGPDLNGKAINETQYRANPKESHLKGTSSLDLGILNAQVLTKKDTQTLTMLNATWTENALQSSDEPNFKRLIIELVMLNIDSKPEPSVLTEEN
ncbi:hypothetical protein Tco_1521165 [Tanacetum coccineum]